MYKPTLITVLLFFIATNCLAQISDLVTSTDTNVFTENEILFNYLSLDGTKFHGDFGDGNTSTAQNSSHSYSNVGNYAVSLSVTDVLGNTKHIAKEKFIKVSNPTANFSSNGVDDKNVSGNTPFTVNFTDTSTDNGSAIVSRLWNFGDGNTSTAQNPTHTYTDLAKFTVALTVTNGFGTDSIHKFIRVLPKPISPPTGNPTQIFVGDDKTIADLTVNGTAIKWYDAYTDGNVLPTTTLLTDNTIYYASQTINTFESFRLAVTTKQISSAIQSVEPGSTVADLTANPSTNNTIKWYTSPSGGTALIGTETLTTGTYYIDQTAPTTITTLATGLGARGHLDIQADGQLLIANGSDLKIANPDGSNIRTLSTQNAESIAVQSDGKILIRVGNIFSASVVRLNADGTNPITLASGLKFQYLEEDVDGRILLTNQFDNDTAGLQRIDADGSNLFEPYGIRGLPSVAGLALGNDGHMLILNEHNQVLEKLFFGVKEVIPFVSWFYGSFALAVAPNDLIYVYRQTRSDLELIRYNETTEEVTQVATVATLERPRGMVVDANGAIILFENSQDLKKVVESYTSNRVAVEVVAVTEPSGLTTQIFAGDDKTVADLSVTGTAIKWYLAATGGTALSTSTLLTDNTIYYSSQTISGAESIARFAVTAKRISDKVQVLPNNTVDDLAATPTTNFTAKWYEAASGGTALSNSAALTESTYYVEQFKPITATSLGSGFGGVRGVAVQSDGKILVVDGNNRDIKRMNADGSNLTTLVSSGLSNPYGITVLQDGKIIVADLSGNEIVRYDADGTNKTVLGSGFSGPSDVAVDADGKIIISDRGNDVIKRMDADGTNIVTLASFNTPYGVAIQSDGKILVTENNGTTIKRMDADGSNIVSLGSGFSSPRYLEQEADGNILIADSGNNVVKRMSVGGTTITTVTNTSLSARVFGIAIEADGNFLVSNSLTSATNIKRIIAEETSNRVTVEVSFVNTWLGVTDNTWFTAANWSGGVPTISLNTVIPAGTPNNPMINLGLNEMNDLTIDAGATLEITPTGTLTIKGNLTNNGTFTIKSDATDNGSLILEGTQTGTGNVQYTRYVTATVNPADAEGWHFLSSPVNGQNISDFKNDVITSGNKYAVATYDNSLATNRYNYYTDNSGANDIDVAGIFLKGKGYSVKRTTAGTFNFSGTLFTEPVPIAITDNSGGVGNKWNLIGNPFASAINLNDDAHATNNFLTVNANKLDPTKVAIYQWNASTASYDIYNHATGSTRFIAPGQGFFVNAIDGGETITFTEALQTHQTGNIFSKSENINPEINLSITDNTSTRKTHIKYFDNSTTDLDIGYDAGVFQAASNSFNVFTHLVSGSEGVDFALQCLPNHDYENMIIPVGMNLEADTTVTISIESLNLPLEIEVYLEDKQNNTFTNLNDENYMFTSTSTINGIGRFFLRTTLQVLDVDNFALENISIYKSSKDNLRIVGVQNGKAKLTLFDLLGKQILATNFMANGVNNVTLPYLKTGIYLVQLQSKKGTKTKKINIE
ncbi:PKD domain-containing protein [uncultured Polaribacter sp.]|uniref:PKD domain-containing protein n=1 Tax=uncultured Polaribacter sp. TaxID=174711 RepID=UPI00261EA126|nr:PKD domain-containing protein [uncultured Polaribacter sp.]